MDIETDGQAPEPVPNAVEATDAPAPTATEEAAPVTAETDDIGDEAAAHAEERKPAKGVQKRLDELTRQRHEAERRAAALEAQLTEVISRLPRPDAPAPAPEKPLTLEAYDYDEAALFTAMTQRAVQEAHKAAETALERREREAIERAAAQSVEQRFDEARAKYADFDEVVFNPSVPITPDMAQVIKSLPDGADVAYQLGRNPSEAARIASLPPVLQAVEIGRLSAPRGQAAPATKPNPPAPPKTVGGANAGAAQKSYADMNMAEYAKARGYA